MWLSDIRAAGTLFHKLYGFKKILELCCLSIKQLCWSLLGMNRVFTESENVIPLSVDPFDFCMSFRVASKTKIKIYIGQNVLLVNEVHNVIEGNSLLEILTTIWWKKIFWTQNRMKCKLCRIIRRDLGFIVVAHRFLKREKLFNFDKVQHWNLIVSRYWWETSPMVGYVASWKNRVAVVGNEF